jgi:hypothetical protein
LRRHIPIQRRKGNRVSPPAFGIPLPYPATASRALPEQLQSKGITIVQRGLDSMRYLVLIAIALWLTPASVRAQEGPPEKESWAAKMFTQAGTSLTHDFGMVPRGAQLLHHFEMTNIYKTPLQITLRIHCGCVTASPSIRELQPSQKGSIDVLMDAYRFTGFKSVNIDVTVANGTKYVSIATLTVTATTRVDVVLNPGKFSFGVVPFGQRTPPQVVDVEYAGALDWKVTGLDKQNAPIDAGYSESFRKPGRVGYQVRVFLKPDAPAGPFKHEIYLKTNDPTSPLVPILVEGHVQASLTVVPNTLNLGNLKVGEELTKLVVVKASKPFRVVSVEGLGDGIAADLPKGEDIVRIIKVTYKPTKEGTVHKQLAIKTSLDQETQATVMLEGAAER